jgi:biopolymer transport protein ExbB
MKLYNLLLLFQETASTAAIGSEEEAAHKSINLFSIIAEGGPALIIMMTALLILFTIALYVFVERYLTIKKASELDPNFMNNVRNNVMNGNIDAAKRLCQTTPSPIARMIEKGLRRLGKPIKEIEVAIENEGRLEINKLERNLSLLSTIAGLAPMFGFLGTIVGVIQIFYNISLSGNLSIGLIAGGLYAKTLSSAAGLLVGIFSFGGYHFLNLLMDRLAGNMEQNTVEFIDLLEEPAN